MKRPVVRFGLDGNFARISELDGVPNKIDQNLRQSSAVTMAWWQFRGHLDFEGQLFVSRQRLQRAANGLGNVLNAVIRKFEFELTGLDLRKIKHVIDESEQVLAVGLKSFEYAKHLLGRLAVSAVRHQFGIAQDGVERRAQLVAHIGEELRLVLACFGELAALVLDFVEQPHVFDGDGRLVGERGGEVDLPLGERTDDSAVQVEHANRGSVAQERHTEHGAKAGSFLNFNQSVFRIGQNIDDMNWFALNQNSASRRPPAQHYRQSFDVFTEAGR